MRLFIRKLLLNFFKLFTAFSFLRLRGKDMLYFQWIYPTLLAIVGSAVCYALSGAFVITQPPSIVSYATSLMGVLIGFYIAALAAVTSFPNHNLDAEIAGDPVVLGGGGADSKTRLTRRRYLSILLGYCAMLAICVYTAGSLGSVISISPEVSASHGFWIRTVCWTLYIWLLSSLVVVTMLCMHYLIDRMHRS